MRRNRKRLPSSVRYPSFSKMPGPKTSTAVSRTDLSGRKMWNWVSVSIVISIRSSDSAPRSVKRSEEHTSELQSLRHLVCRLLLGSKEYTSELQSLRHLVCRFLFAQSAN